VIGVDTNVLVRYLVKDDSERAARAAILLEVECTMEHPAYINRIVMCELVWVL
jgi:predicted nucleic-acid-binding protein